MIRTRSTRDWRVLSLIIALAASTGASASDTPKAEGAADERVAIAGQRAQLAQRVDELQRRIADAAESGALRSELGAELDLLERIDRLHADQLAAIDEATTLTRSQESIERQLAAGPAEQVTAAPPYSLQLLDGLWDALDAQRSRLTVLEAALERAQEELDTARRRFEAQERRRREVKEEAGESHKSDDAIERAQNRRALQLEELESQLASARSELSRLQMENAERAVTAQRQAAALVGSAVSWVEERLAVAPEELEAPLGRVERERFDLDRNLERAKQQLALAEQRLNGVQNRIAEGAVLEGEIAAELAARQQEQRAALRRVEFLERKHTRLDSLEQWWGHRFAVLTGRATSVEMRAWKGELERLLTEWDTRRRLERTRLSELRDEQLGLRDRLARAREAKRGEARWLAEELTQLDALLQLYAGEVANVEQSARLLERTRQGIERRDTSLTLAERAQWLSGRTQELLTTELTSIDDRPITAGKILTALVLVFMGFALSRWLSAAIGGALSRRARLDAGASAAFQSLSFYLLLLAFLLVALNTANIPLTVFTLAGGAVAIGIGFGSQNIVNNFISGLILLVERPIKVGDLVEVDGTQGIVDRIGARSTVVRTFDNTNIIMPNSTFLETNVLNWTLSDTVIRSRVDVGVAYGSSPREVERLLGQAMEAREEILAQPEPFVRFLEFGDSALLFGAYFWLRLGPATDRLLVTSELRHSIVELLGTAEIEIAFPQRDLHLKSAVALRIEREE